MRWFQLAPALTAAALLGCAARTHLTETQGQACSAAFSRQAPAPLKVTGPVKGLDSQEAAIIAEGYRASLAPKQVQVKEEPLVLVAPPQRGTPALPLPSVPKER